MSDGDERGAKRPSAATRRSRGGFARFLDLVERVGNLLPNPVTLFVVLSVAVVAASGIAARLGLEVADRRPGKEGEVLRVVSLVDAEGLRLFLTNLVPNFTGFAPLGTVLVALLGVGVAERSGLLSAAIRGLVTRAPRSLLTPTIVFAGVLSNVASDAGFVVLVPLAAVVFLAFGRHPIAGLAAGFAGVSGGYSANLFIGTIDPLLAGITTEAAALAGDPRFEPGGPLEVNAAANWYFMAASTFLITALGTYVTDRIVSPRLGAYDASRAEPGASEAVGAGLAPLSRLERKGLLAALAALIVFALAIALMIVPEGGALREAAPGEGFLRQIRPAMRSIVALIFLLFLATGVVYGRVVGTLRSDRDVVDAMSHAMSTMGLYLVLVFVAAQFVMLFEWTNLGLIVAVAGAGALEQAGMTGPIVFVPFILVCGLVNMLIGSSSAKWALTAPVFVPMLMFAGYSPEVIQAAYRIGDSTTNLIAPLMSYFGLILAYACRYDRSLGIGTVVATMLPYTLVFLAGWVALFYVWVFALGLPVGPGAPIRYAFPG